MTISALCGTQWSLLEQEKQKMHPAARLFGYLLVILDYVDFTNNPVWPTYLLDASLDCVFLEHKQL